MNQFKPLLNLPPRERLANVEYQIGDVRDLSGFILPRGTSRIYNLAAVHTTPGHEPSEYYDTNVTGAIEVTRLAARSGVGMIVFTSSISVYGSGEDAKTEKSVPNPNSDYGRSKWMAEKIYQTWADVNESRRLLIVRPAVVFGAGERGNFTRMAKLLQNGFFVFPGRRDTVKACIYVGDLLDAVEFAQNFSERLLLFNAAYPQRYTIGQIVDTFSFSYFPGAKKIVMPRQLVSLAARILRVFGGARIGIHPDRVMKLVKSTDVVPGWLSSNGWTFEDALVKALARWERETEGRFD